MLKGQNSGADDDLPAWLLATIRKDTRQPFKETIQDYRTELYMIRGTRTFSSTSLDGEPPKSK
jgi:hypothetical protein